MIPEAPRKDSYMCIHLQDVFSSFIEPNLHTAEVLYLVESRWVCEIACRSREIVGDTPP